MRRFTWAALLVLGADLATSEWAWSDEQPVGSVNHYSLVAADASSENASQEDPADAGLGEQDELVDELLNLDVDQLSNVSVEVSTEVTSAALTETTRTAVPAAITRISQEQIEQSGARSLNELLEIYVPSLQWIRHHWEQNHIGLRGIISDREDKYLILVNGRIMNDKTHFGGIHERDLVQLDDIHHIDVIRGPGSAVLGPGAVSMVISIYTDTARTFNGTKVKVRGGIRDQFSSIEFKRGAEWENADGGIFLYAGIGTRDGAPQKYAPLVFGGSDPGGPVITTYQDYVAGTEVGTPINNDYESFQGQMPMKFFADMTYEDFEIWARYTRSGSQYPIAPAAAFHLPNGFGEFVPQGQAETGNQQLTLHSKYETEVTDSLKFIATLGWDRSDFVRYLFFGVSDAYREEELNYRAILVQELGENHQFATGMEFYSDWFGLGQDLIEAPPTNGSLGANFTPWNTSTFSILFEDQWKWNDQFTMFVGGRLDKNNYTPWMYSPRSALIYTPDEFITWKALLNRSVRQNFAEELRRQWIASQTNSPPEILRSYELRRESTLSDYTNWALSAYYIDLDALSFEGGAAANIITGRQKQWGMEGEWMTQYRGCTFIASHAFTKMIEFELASPTFSTFITAAPYGYGDDLANWSNHISKISLHREVNYHLSFDTTLRYYWGFPGLKDMNAYRDATGGDGYSKSEPGWQRTYQESVFWNLSLTYRHNDHLKFRVDGYNLLGAFERDLNKRHYYSEHGFRSEAVALGLTAEMQY